VVDLEEVVHSNVVLPDVVLVKKVASATAATDDHDEGTGEADNEETVMEGKRRVSKRKLRRRKKQDKKQRELEEAAVRMGFFEDVEGNANDDDNHDLVDEDLVADLEAVEKELATYQEEQKQQDQQGTGDQENPHPEELEPLPTESTNEEAGQDHLPTTLNDE
jgi:hypothetical protein